MLQTNSSQKKYYPAFNMIRKLCSRKNRFWLLIILTFYCSTYLYTIQNTGECNVGNTIPSIIGYLECTLIIHQYSIWKYLFSAIDCLLNQISLHQPPLMYQISISHVSHKTFHPFTRLSFLAISFSTNHMPG